MASADNPNLIQVAEMVKFCNSYKNIYIYNENKNQVLIEKFFNSISIKIKGYLVDYNNQIKENLNKPVYSLEDSAFVNSINPNESGVIISNEDSMFNWSYKQLKERGLTNIYVLSEWNKRTIPYKMTPRTRENMLVEVNVVDRCNLNCCCCDHFSPIADKFFLDVEEFRRDLSRLAGLMDNKIGAIKLEGGEPTLHPRLVDFFRVTREIFPDCIILFFTNGTNLLRLEKAKNNIWEIMKKYDVTLMVTTYPINTDYEEIDKKAKQYDIKYRRFFEIGDRDKDKLNQEKKSVLHPLDVEGKIDKYQYISCYHFNECITLRHGKIYTCPIIPYSEHFNRQFNKDLKITKNCYIDIYKAKSYEEIAEHCTHRTDFCNYCNIAGRRAIKWEKSDKDIKEWT